MTPKLDGFGIVVSDMARALDFYRRLGLDFPEGSETQPHVEAELGSGVRYMIDTEEVMRAFDPEWKRPTDGHLVGGAVRCDSPEEVDRLAERGVVVREIPNTGLVRVSCGYWTSDDDLERLVAGLG